MGAIHHYITKHVDSERGVNGHGGNNRTATCHVDAVSTSVEVHHR